MAAAGDRLVIGACPGGLMIGGLGIAAGAAA